MYADTQKSIPKWHAGWSKICPTMDNMRAALALRERTKMYQVRKINSLNCIHSFLCNKRASDSHQVQPCSWYYMVPLVPPGQMLRIGYIFFLLFSFSFTKLNIVRTVLLIVLAIRQVLHCTCLGPPGLGYPCCSSPSSLPRVLHHLKKIKCRLWCEIQILCLMPVSFSPCKKVSLVTCVLYCIFPILS